MTIVIDQRKSNKTNGCPAFRRGMTILIVLLLFSRDGSANSFRFLNRIYSPRIGALAGAFTARYGDVTGLFINPAGLAYIDHHQITMNVMDHFLDLKGGMIGYHHPLPKWGNVSFGVLYFDYGSFKEVDRYGLETGRNFSAKDLAFAVSYSFDLGDQLALGLSIKQIYSRMDQYQAAAIASDLGILYFPGFISGTSVGLALLNSGYNFHPYQKIKEQMPFVLRMGLSYELLSLPLTVSLELDHRFGEHNDFAGVPVSLSMGGEYSFRESIIMRIGYNHQQRKDLSIISRDFYTGFSVGFGIHLDNHSLDYCFNDCGALGNLHRLGVTFRFEKLRLKRKTIRPDGVLLNPPKNLRIEPFDGQMILRWDGVEDCSYNVYVCHTEQREWRRINRQLLSQLRLTIKRPKVEGIYNFTVTAVINNTESPFAHPVSIAID